MKIFCNTIELSEACQNVQRAASSKTAIPAIEGILLVAKEGAREVLEHFWNNRIEL